MVLHGVQHAEIAGHAPTLIDNNFAFGMQNIYRKEFFI
jgi:hypothetical protein